jgi:hypothetical protein
LVPWEHARLELGYDFSNWHATFHQVDAEQHWGTDDRFNDLRHLNWAGAAGWQAYDRFVVWVFDPLRMLKVTYSMRRKDPPVPWKYARLELGYDFSNWHATFHQVDGEQRRGSHDRFDDLRHLNWAGAAGWQAYDRSVVWVSGPLRMLRVTYSMRREDPLVAWEYARLEYRPTGSFGTDNYMDWDAVFHRPGGVERWGIDDRFDDLRHLNGAGAAGWQAYDRCVIWLGNRMARVTYSMRREDPLVAWEYARLEYAYSGREWDGVFHHPGGVERWGTDDRFNDLRHLNRAGAAGWQAYDRSVVWVIDGSRLHRATYLMRRPNRRTPE